MRIPGDDDSPEFHNRMFEPRFKALMAPISGGEIVIFGGLSRAGYLSTGLKVKIDRKSQRYEGAYILRPSQTNFKFQAQNNQCSTVDKDNTIVALVEDA